MKKHSRKLSGPPRPVHPVVGCWQGRRVHPPQQSYYVETVEDVAARVRACLELAPPDRLAFAPDCGFSQTARWATGKKLTHLAAGVAAVRRTL